jgi:hypothetical protein
MPRTLETPPSANDEDNRKTFDQRSCDGDPAVGRMRRRLLRRRTVRRSLLRQFWTLLPGVWASVRRRFCDRRISLPKSLRGAPFLRTKLRLSTFCGCPHVGRLSWRWVSRRSSLKVRFSADEYDLEDGPHRVSKSAGAARPRAYQRRGFPRSVFS